MKELELNVMAAKSDSTVPESTSHFYKYGTTGYFLCFLYVCIYARDETQQRATGRTGTLSHCSEDKAFHHLSYWSASAGSFFNETLGNFPARSVSTNHLDEHLAF